MIPERSTRLLSLRNVTVNYGRGRRRLPDAVQDVSLDLTAGETLALVGESGSGKSTVGNVVLGLVPVRAGTVTFAGEDITHATGRRRRELTRHIQPIFQDPYGSLNPVRTIRQTLVEPLLAHERLTAAEQRERVALALSRVGLEPDAADRYPAQFSGGQRQRIAIARALMVSPRLIVCDEPTSALDLSVQAQVLNLLRQLQRELRVSYLFITHDLAIVRHVADRVAVLRRGRIVETGPTEQVYENPREAYTRALIAAAPVPDPEQQRRRRLLTGAAQSGSPGPARPAPAESTSGR